MNFVIAALHFIWQAIRALALALRRALCLLLPLAAVYVLVGSFLFGEWWFAFLFKGKILSAAYWRDAFLVLLNGYFYWTLALGILIALTAFAIVMVWRKLVGVIDKHFAPILFVSAVVFLLNVSFLYKLEKDNFAQSDSFEAAVGEWNRALANFYDQGKDQGVDGPYDFVYVEDDRINALYSQLEPEMIETERTIKKEKEASGKASATVGPLSGEAQGKDETAESSSYQPTKSSIQRKCVDVMKFLDSKSRVRHYSDRQAWIRKRTVNEVHEQIDRMQRDGQLQKITPLGDVKEVEKQQQERLKRLAAEMQVELSSLNGFVIIDGDFDLDRTKDSTQVWEEFSRKPFSRIRFYGVLSNAELKLESSERAARRMHSRMFASVMQPLDKDGVIRVHPLAVF